MIEKYEKTTRKIKELAETLVTEIEDSIFESSNMSIQGLCEDGYTLNIKTFNEDDFEIDIADLLVKHFKQHKDNKRNFLKFTKEL